MPSDPTPIDRWSAVAPFWEKYHAIIRNMFVPVTQALVEDARIAARHAVLDVATGPGEPALSIAPLVGPEGRLCGVDPAPQMVSAARRAADHLGFTHIQFEVAFANLLPFPNDTFDAAVCRFGAMFFPSPPHALREMLRVLKPGGKLALAVWGSYERNPFFRALQQVVDRYVDSPPPRAVDTFCFATPGKLRDVLAACGAAAPWERLLQFNIRLPLAAEDFWTLRCEMSENLREKIATLSGERLADARRGALEALRAYSQDGGLSFPAEVLIVSGTKRSASD